MSSLNTTAKSSAVAAINEVNTKLAKLYRVNVGNDATAAQFVNLIKDGSTGDVMVFQVNTTISAFLFGSASSYGGVVFVLKASSNNAYFFWFTRGAATIGNISLSDGTVSARTQLA